MADIEITQDHERIWLGPTCQVADVYGRQWCQDRLDDCDHCELPAVEYVRADLVEQARISAKLEAEREIVALAKQQAKTDDRLSDAYQERDDKAMSARIELRARLWEELADAIERGEHRKVD